MMSYDRQDSVEKCFGPTVTMTEMHNIVKFNSVSLLSSDFPGSIVVVTLEAELEVVNIGTP